MTAAGDVWSFRLVDSAGRACEAYDVTDREMNAALFLLQRRAGREGGRVQCVGAPNVGRVPEADARRGRRVRDVRPLRVLGEVTRSSPEPPPAA